MPPPDDEGRRRRLLSVLCLLCLTQACAGQIRDGGGIGVRESNVRLQTSLTAALQGTAASAVVLRLSDGRVLARSGAEQPASPGSTLKPLLLSWALRHGIVQPGTKVFCSRSLQVGAHRLACTHPSDQATFTARSALAESCNTYFAALGMRMRGSDLESALRSTHLPHADATSDKPEQRELTALGLSAVTATPTQLAQAYRELILHEDQHGPVILGLADSVAFGMADPARTEGFELLGKTGTATDLIGRRTHGWFAGALPGSMVIVLYLPDGGGGAAAAMAGAFFRTALATGKR
jgi:cell division protein FtsI/penicillin-binding protein 2